MAVIVAIAADHTREVHFLPALKRRLVGVPAGLAAALVIFATGYRGLHTAIYGIGGNSQMPGGARMTHTPNAEYPHDVHGGANPVSAVALTAEAAKRRDGIPGRVA